jgi:hypothetical protein
VIGHYKINHDQCKWEVSDEELPVQNAFHGHQHEADGYFDWGYKHHRMVMEGSRFHIGFDLPDRVKNSGNEVRLTVAYFGGWNCDVSTVSVYVNDHKLRDDQVKGED